MKIVDVEKESIESCLYRVEYIHEGVTYIARFEDFDFDLSDSDIENMIRNQSEGVAISRKDLK